VGLTSIVDLAIISDETIRVHAMLLEKQNVSMLCTY